MIQRKIRQAPRHAFLRRALVYVEEYALVGGHAPGDWVLWKQHKDFKALPGVKYFS